MSTQSEHINELASALSKAQGQMQSAKKDKSNPFFKSKYADLESVWDCCRQALTENGLAVVQIPSFENSTTMLNTIMTHSSGQWIKGQIPVETVKKDAQGIGSALTYYRRYCLMAITGVSAGNDDDDGNFASGNTNQYQGKTVNAKKVEEVKFEQPMKYIESEKLKVLTHMIGSDMELTKMILTFYGIDTLSKIPEDISDKIIKKVSQRIEEKLKKSQELVEENRKVMEA